MTNQPDSQKAQRTMVIRSIAIVVVVIGFVVVAIQFRQAPPTDTQESGEPPDNSVEYESQGHGHISIGEDHEPYNSNPPTSGPHIDPVYTRVYTQEVPDEFVITNLELGHIWLSYRDKEDEEALELLREIQNTDPDWIVVSYRSGNDSRIAAAAWTRLLKLDELDREQIEAFITRYKDTAPEVETTE